MDNSTQSPCWQQRQIARQQAFLRSTIEDREVVLQAKCDAQPKPAQKAEAKAS